jgi:hypothetical protein
MSFRILLVLPARPASAEQLSAFQQHFRIKKPRIYQSALIRPIGMPRALNKSEHWWEQKSQCDRTKEQ